MKDLPGDSKDHQLTVALRIRPLNDAEVEEGATMVAHKVDDQVVVLMDPCEDPDDVLRANRSREKTYMFDVAFDFTASQEDVYVATTKNLIEGVISGYNATVFAYGPTGAGKTYTMLGVDTEPGIYIRTLNDLFKAIETSTDVDCSVFMSYIEIYNEMIRDLLNPASGYLDLREDAKGEIHITGITEFSTSNAKEIMALLTKGNKQRTQEPTAANKTSSRSHAILQVTVKQQNSVRSINEEVRVGKLFMVDLAGTERASQTQNKGKRMKEGAHINLSLLALANCINALSEKGGRGAQFINYRDSKLTRLLKDALGGNSRTVMITHISPASSNFEESRNTLIYADKAKSIRTKVKRNLLNMSYHLVQYTSIIAELRQEIERLRAKMDEQCQEQRKSEKADIRNVQAEVQQYSRKEMGVLRDQLLSVFREQMEIRHSLMELENSNMELHVDTSTHLVIISDWERERRRCLRRGSDEGSGEKRDREKEEEESGGEEEEEEEEELVEPQEVTAAREEIGPLLAEQRKTMALKCELEEKLCSMKLKSSRIEELLPKRISNEEQREILSLLCKVHELEVENTEIQSAVLCKENALRTKDFIIQRHEQSRALCDDIIHQQKAIIEDHGLTIPCELQQLYHLYFSDMAEGGIDQIINLHTITSNTMRDGSTARQLKLGDLISELNSDPNDLCTRAGAGPDNRKSSLPNRKSSFPNSKLPSNDSSDSNKVFKSASRCHTLRSSSPPPQIAAGARPTMAEPVSPDTLREIVSDTKSISVIAAQRRSQVMQVIPPTTTTAQRRSQVIQVIPPTTTTAQRRSQVMQVILPTTTTAQRRSQVMQVIPPTTFMAQRRSQVMQVIPPTTFMAQRRSQVMQASGVMRQSSEATGAEEGSPVQASSTERQNSMATFTKATGVTKATATFTKATGVAAAASVDSRAVCATDERLLGSSLSQRGVSRPQRRTESLERRSESFEVNGRRKPIINASRNGTLESVSDNSLACQSNLATPRTANRLGRPAHNTHQPLHGSLGNPVMPPASKVKGHAISHHSGEVQKLEIRGTPPSTIQQKHSDSSGRTHTLLKRLRGPADVSSASQLLLPGNHKRPGNHGNAHGNFLHKGTAAGVKKNDVRLKKLTT